MTNLDIDDKYDGLTREEFDDDRHAALSRRLMDMQHELMQMRAEIRSIRSGVRRILDVVAPSSPSSEPDEADSE